MTTRDREFMELAIAEMLKCDTEPGRDNPPPLVGAVAVKNGELLGSAYRCEMGPGDHAEFTLLEKKLPAASLAGATVYTTLEPCTERSQGKEPCASRLSRRKVGRVVIGMLDPDQRICGRGVRELRKANVITDLFPPDLMQQVEEANREFIKDRENSAVAEIRSTVDLILKVEQHGIVLIERATKPIGWSLPGTFVKRDEHFKDAAIRTALEELRVDQLDLLRQFHTFSSPSRDLRGRIVTTVYTATTRSYPKLTDRVKSVRWVKNQQDVRVEGMLFDHARILSEFFRRGA